MATARQKTTVRREQIAQAALDLLAEHGPADVSMAGIADRLGLATSAIYRHFPGKDEVIDAVLDLIDERLQANVAEASRGAAPPLERLEGLLQRHVALVKSNSGIPRLLFSGEVFCGGESKRDRLHRLITGYLARVADILRDAQRLGSVRADIDAATLAVSFLGIVQPAVILAHLSGGRFDAGRHATLGWNLFVEAARPARCEAPAGAHNHRPHGGQEGGRSWTR